jgi:hypothetical protein
VKSTISALDLVAQLETPSRALLDYLSQSKELMQSIEKTKNFPKKAEALEIKILKLISILINPTSRANVSALDFIEESETKRFWQIFFGETAYSATWGALEAALKEQYPFLMKDVLNDLRLYLDHFNTGHVVCHSLSDFAGDQLLGTRLADYRDKKITMSPITSPSPQHDSVFLPLLLWVDDHPSNNESFVEYARGLKICTIVLSSTLEAKRWLINHHTLLELEDQNQFHIITDNAREGADTILDINAGEDIIRFVRARRSIVPILVYCGNPTYAQYTSKYKYCQIGTKSSECQKFIEELILNRDRPHG